MFQQFPRIAIVIAVLFVIPFLTSCIGIETGAKITPEQQRTLVKGKTTKPEVLNNLGDPHQRIDMESGEEQFSYISNVVNNFGGASMSRTEFWVLFKNDVVSDFGERPTQKLPTR
jgi:outer membrane protein assembly factor BamE (lipoprotein component of BamABCDE complex)